MRCCICNSRLVTGGYVCQKCKELWSLSGGASTWPAWALALKNAEQKERRRAGQWRGRLVNYGDDAELDDLIENKEAGRIDTEVAHVCVDCGTPISDTAQRCYHCSTKARHRAGVYDTEAVRSYRERVREEGVPLSPEARQAMSDGLKAAHARGAYEGAYKQISKPERAIAAKLDDLGIEYQQQYRIGDDTRRFDFYLPAMNLLVEFDGTYWHSLPGKAAKDADKEAFAVANGYRLLRIAEEDYNREGIEIVATLLECA